MDRYALHSIPAGVLFGETLCAQPAARASVETVKWSGTLPPPPEVGAPILVVLNGLGPGVVRSFFVRAGWLGVAVELLTPPEWFIKQNGGQLINAEVYGAEVGQLSCDKCSKRAPMPAVAVRTCCGRVYARCEAHGGGAGAERSRNAHRALEQCQKGRR